MSVQVSPPQDPVPGAGASAGLSLLSLSLAAASAPRAPSSSDDEHDHEDEHDPPLSSSAGSHSKRSPPHRRLSSASQSRRRLSDARDAAVRPSPALTALALPLDGDDDDGAPDDGKKGRKRGTLFTCESCSKVYRHPSCLIKHRWEHTPHWREASKLMLSKHQQVQLMEAAAILSHLAPSATGGSSLPDDRSLWPSFLSGGTLPGAQPIPAPQRSSAYPKTASPVHPKAASLPNGRGGPRLHAYAMPARAAPTRLRPGVLAVPTPEPELERRVMSPYADDDRDARGEREGSARPQRVMSPYADAPYAEAMPVPAPTAAAVAGPAGWRGWDAGTGSLGWSAGTGGGWSVPAWSAGTGTGSSFASIRTPSSASGEGDASVNVVESEDEDEDEVMDVKEEEEEEEGEEWDGMEMEMEM